MAHGKGIDSGIFSHSYIREKGDFISLSALHSVIFSVPVRNRESISKKGLTVGIHVFRCSGFSNIGDLGHPVIITNRVLNTVLDLTCYFDAEWNTPIGRIYYTKLSLFPLGSPLLVTAPNEINSYLYIIMSEFVLF